MKPKRIYVTANAGKLARLRVKRGLLCEQAAPLLELSPKSLSNIEAGAACSPQVLSRMAKAYAQPLAAIKAAYRSDVRRAVRRRLKITDNRAEKSLDWREEGISKANRYARKHRATHPERARARNLVTTAIAQGRLVRPGHCEACNAPCTPHGHHDDYSKPFAIRWLCSPCHRSLHGAKKSA